jgi:hypothetical protein
MGSWRRRAFRIAAWIAFAVLIAIAFHYGKKYEGDMLTGTGSELTSLSRGIAPIENLGPVAPESGASGNAGDAMDDVNNRS